jgi:uncharacterized cupredoxin-like copper-binding protein
MRQVRRRATLWKTLALLVAVGAPGCTSERATTSSGGSPVKSVNEGNVAVRLFEFRVEPDQAAASDGEVSFAIHNDGDYAHEFKIARLDEGTTQLPTGRDGSAKEDAGGFEILAEIPARKMGPGYSKTLTLDLEPGDYVLFCNIVIDGGGFAPTESHYKMGMHTTFTVT